MTAKTIDDEQAAALALRALGWVLGEDARASRLLALTGLDPASLRVRVGEPVVLAAVLHFLEQYQPDMVTCAAALGEDPARLVEARKVLDPECRE